MPAIPSTWLEEFIVNLTTTGIQSRPTITHLANGNILVVWDSTDDTGAGSSLGVDMIGQIFTSQGVPIGSEFRVNDSFFADDERNGDVAALASGGFVAVYEDFDAINNNRSIRLTERDADGLNPVTVTIIADASNNADPAFFNPKVAVSSNTSVLVVYQEEEVGGDSRIVGTIYDSVAGTVGPEISLINFPGNNTQPSVAVLTNGNYVIAASSNVTGDASSSITYRIITATGANALGVTAITNTRTDADSDRDAVVTGLTGGGFVIAWTNTDINDTDIKVQQFNAAGVEQGAVINVGDGSATDNNNEPAVVALQDGGFIVFFDDDVAGQLRGSRYSSTGTLVSGDFLISSGGGGIDEIDAELLADGRVAVTFERADGEIGMEIIDIRDTPNVGGVYTPDSQIVGTIGNDTFTAEADLNFGHTGNDTITDGGGINQIFGGAGDDTITIIGVDAAETVEGGAGDDTLVGTGMSNGTIYNLAAGTVTLGASVQVATSFLNVTGSSANETLIGNGAGNVLDGGIGNDTINGGGGGDVIFGGDGDDQLSGQTGDDTMTGGAGNDTYFVNSAGDVVDEGAGLGTADMVRSSVTFNLISAGGEIENLTLLDGAAINGTGNALANRIVGNTSVNTINGGSGNDALLGGGSADSVSGGNNDDDLVGGGGDDDMAGGSGNDNLFGGANNDDLFGGVGNDRVYGGTQNDTVTASDGSDVLFGGAGADTLTGGAGNDRLYGGTGAVDLFIFASGFDDDVLIDFDVGLDTIRIVGGFNSGDVTLTTVGAHVRATLTTGDTLLIQNVTVAEVSTFNDWEFL